MTDQHPVRILRVSPGYRWLATVLGLILCGLDWLFGRPLVTGGGHWRAVLTGENLPILLFFLMLLVAPLCVPAFLARRLELRDHGLVLRELLSQVVIPFDRCSGYRVTYDRNSSRWVNLSIPNYEFVDHDGRTIAAFKYFYTHAGEFDDWLAARLPRLAA